MSAETQVIMKFDSLSLFEALREQVGEWRLGEYAFDPAADEMRMSYDSGGSGRVALTVVFELNREQMAQLLQNSAAAE